MMMMMMMMMIQSSEELPELYFASQIAVQLVFQGLPASCRRLGGCVSNILIVE
jgi:hypothetical protein